MFSPNIVVIVLALTALAPCISAQICPAVPTSLWSLSRFDALVAFGDSYTDEVRLAYLIEHNGTAPPPGHFVESPDYRPWARQVIRYTGETVDGVWTPAMKLYNYAVAGAVCSNSITPRPFPLLNMNFPAVLDDEIPTFITDLATSQHQPALDSSHTVYSLFIGTNDLGNNGFATDSQVPGTVLADYTSCIFNVLDRLYAAGARYFLLLNTVPLHLLPQYANETLGSVVNTRFYPDKEANHTRVAQKMHQLTTSANEILKYQTPFELLVAKRYPGAHVALFDTYALFSDIYHTPELYLNGTEKANVKGWIEHCDLDFTNCVKEFEGKSDDSFMWFDELHPSEQVHKILGREIVETLKGRGAYATYWSG